MNYELVSVIRPHDPIWQQQKARLKKQHGQVLSVAPSPDFGRLLESEAVAGINVISQLTKQVYQPEQFLFFNQVPVPPTMEVFMNENRTISLIQDGEEVGEVVLYPQTRRHVKEIRYLHSDGTTDFVEEYTADGQVFSNVFFHQQQVQEIVFFDQQQVPIVSYHFYEGTINLVTIREPKTLAVTQQFPNLFAFLAEQVAQHVTEKDTVHIAYMGMELFALAQSKSHNILHLSEPPLDENGQVKGNLASILEDRIPYIHEVHLSAEAFAQLKDAQLPLTKAKIVVADDEG